jgi:CDP-diacylglycerol--glycerol-3-phosphate 3-phosphatidyltransferase
MAFMVVDNFWTRLSSFFIFIIASLTDWYDGKIARETGTVTVVGTFLDHLVDKMLIAAALVGFVEMRQLHIPAWMVVLIISREFLITGLRSLAASRGIVMAPSRHDYRDSVDPAGPGGQRTMAGGSAGGWLQRFLDA